MDILDEKGVLDKKIMNFVVNKTPVKVFKEGAFGGTYFKDIYPGVDGKWYRKSWKELNQLKDVDHEFYCSDHYDVSVNKYGVKCRTSLRFQEDNGWINSVDPYGWFQWYFRCGLGRRSENDKRQINKWNKIVIRFKL